MMGERVSGGDDDVVQIQQASKPGDPFIVTVNCPDKTGLACDICRIILDFGLSITKADLSTDGVWCYIVLWVIQCSPLLPLSFSYLKNRLQAICPPFLASFYHIHQPSTSSPVYLLKFCCLDRKGLLHDVTKVLSELELAIQKVKVTTTPDGRVLDLFFITDNMELLHTRKRQDETCERLNAVLRDSCISCELQLAGPEYECNQGITSLSSVLAEELFRCKLSDNEVRSQALSPDMTKLKKTNVTIDNSLSPAHTLVQIQCADHKGLLYDVMRTVKDMNMKILYGRFSPTSTGYRDLDIFIQQKDGKKILDAEKQSALCSRLKLEMLHPLRVIIANRGPDNELLVANPVELSGKGRPRVFYDVTFALKTLGICVFSAEVGRHSVSEREWEVYRFLLDENCEFQLTSVVARNQIVDKVRRTLMGWFIVFYNSGRHCEECISLRIGKITVDRVDGFLKHCPAFPNAFLNSLADTFVTELTDQLQKLKVEPVLLLYLSEIKVLQGTISTTQMLHINHSILTCHFLSNYKCIRLVHHTASEELDLLFPSSLLMSTPFQVRL